VAFVGGGVGVNLRLGRWQDALADVEMVDSIITDPPYGERTHKSETAESKARSFDGSARRALDYDHLGSDDVQAFCESWVPRCSGWMCVQTSHDLCSAWETAMQVQGRYVFAPIPCVMPGMTVRLCGDGPSSWCVWMIVSRPRTMKAWGTLPGAYQGAPGRKKIVPGGKPLWLMRAIIRDYTKPGDLVCDPFAGGGTTLLAAAMEGRRAIGAEMDPKTHALATERLAKGYTKPLFVDDMPKAQQGDMWEG
jgi:site-specific DNA-methyltransferase (adenine-specific)